MDEFCHDFPSNFVYFITGVRGSGKTVFMYSIANRLNKDNDWIVANIGPMNHILETVVAQIFEQGKLKHLFMKTEFSFSFNGFTLSLPGKEPVADIMTLLKKNAMVASKKTKNFL